MTNQLIHGQMEMGEIETDADRLPFGVVEIGPEENSFPFVQKTRMQIQLSIEQFQTVIRLTLSDGQQSFGQCGAETETQIVSFLSIGLDGHERGSVERHGRGVLTQLAVETERTLASEFVDRFVFQVRSARATVKTRDVNAAQQFDGTVFTAVIGRTETLVIGHTIRASGAVLARLVTGAFVDFQLAIVSLVARKTLTRVIVDSVQASAEFTRRLTSRRCGCG